ncbi:MAG: hypothetical protein M3Y76_11595, partial [Chloroflexota bacterium]|nr:hypothetical protein [Chloroflexota bacterium]
MNVRYSTGGKPPTIEIEYGLAYEFLLSLIVFNEQEGYEYELGNEWFDTVRARADPDLLQATALFRSNCNHVWHRLVGLVYDSDPPRNV